ncbi:hypothetical protein MS3_00004819 [Schistosoma haematobium]|uniref:Uncharacterized protein n=1 Tax=Schistosoma haematobium TaxID=6185 RepID=A0A922ISZ9_SCHHA|nr:hypothetical protein MS3_00004819 [Schistosoma haematobium]KAH9586863.1 hypothetical protein MS3_00004819 [Schistosoma haematobium]
MNNVASERKIVEIYQNDHTIHGSDITAHHQRLIALLHWRSQKNIKGNTSRCSFCVSSFECLGTLSDINGSKPDMKQLASLTNAFSKKSYRTKLTSRCSLISLLFYS